jgi:tetratricopeptide (TPR) repeat protein
LHPWYLEQLRERHPDAVWPKGTGAVDPRKVIATLRGSRPAFFDLSVRAEQLLPTGGSVAHALFNHGIAQQVFYTGESLNLRHRGEFNLRFLETALQRLEPLPRDIDFDTKSIFLQYAIAFYRTGQMLQQVKDFDLALRAYRSVLKFDPDRHERDIGDEVRRGIGQQIPEYHWGRKAQLAITNIEAAGR